MIEVAGDGPCARLVMHPSSVAHQNAWTFFLGIGQWLWHFESEEKLCNGRWGRMSTRRHTHFIRKSQKTSIVICLPSSEELPPGVFVAQLAVRSVPYLEPSDHFYS